MNGIKYSKAYSVDIPQLCEIGDESGLSPWTRRSYENEIGRRDSVILKAIGEHDVVAGFVAGRVAPPGGDAEINNIGVRASFRRSGIGSELLRMFVEASRQSGSTKVWLEVRASNAGAIAFYHKHGFVWITTRKAFYSAPIEDAQILCLQL